MEGLITLVRLSGLQGLDIPFKPAQGIKGIYWLLLLQSSGIVSGTAGYQYSMSSLRLLALTSSNVVRQARKGTHNLKTLRTHLQSH